MTPKKKHKDLDANEAELLRSAGPAFERWIAAHGACPQPDLLRAAHAGALPDEISEQVNLHVRGCAACRQLQADMDAHEYLELSPEETGRLLARVQKEAGAEQAKSARAGRRLFFRPAVVMGALAILAAVVLLKMDRPTTKVEAPALPRAHTAPPAPPPLPEFVLALVKPEVKLTASALVFRGEGPSDFLKDISSALDAYRADQFAEAAKLLVPLSKKYPKSVEVWFYLGVSQLLSHDAPGAVRSLETAGELEEKSFADDVAWYLSVALERAARPNDAIPLLKKQCSGKGTHQSDACVGVEILERRAPEESGPPSC